MAESPTTCDGQYSCASFTPAHYYVSTVPLTINLHPPPPPYSYLPYSTVLWPDNMATCLTSDNTWSTLTTPTSFKLHHPFIQIRLIHISLLLLIHSVSMASVSALDLLVAVCLNREGKMWEWPVCRVLLVNYLSPALADNLQLLVNTWCAESL